MFVGHYGVSCAAKRWAPSLPLWLLFVAVQFLDVLWAPLVLLGIEKVRIVPGITRSNPLDLYYMPYSHGLPSAVLLSLLIGGVVALVLPGNRFVIVAAVALTAFSHWLGDSLHGNCEENTWTSSG